MSALGHEDRKLKAATKRLMQACGGQEGAAATIGEAKGVNVRQQRLSDCGNDKKPDFLRVDEVAILEDSAERDGAWPHVTRVLAARCGFILVPRPVVIASKADWLQGSAGVSKEASDVQTAIADAFADDGEVDGDEADRIISECDAGIERLLQLRMLAEMAKQQ